MQDIRELKVEPTIGETYLVPRAYVDSSRWRMYGVPVLMEKAHADPELDNETPHYHIDYRFSDLDILEGLLQPGAVATWYFGNAPAVRADVLPIEIRVEPMECLRTFPARNWRVSKYMAAVQEVKQKGGRVKLDCLTCPHRGTPLGSAPRDLDGNFWCPAHGLKFDKSTGEVLA